MRALITLTVGLLFLAVSAYSAQKRPGVHGRPVPIQKSRDAYMKSMKRRCDDGIASSCNDYGLALQNEKDPKLQKKGEFYVRRACMLAYAPACGNRTHSKEVVSKTVVNESAKKNAACAQLVEGAAKLDGDGRSVAEVSSGSLLDKSGIKAGDEIVSINGQEFKSPDQVAQALANGGAVVTVKRNGKEASIMVNCP